MEEDEPYRTVVMLGAGASAGSTFSLPVMKGFFDPNGKTPISCSLKKELRHIYGDDVDLRTVNVEDVFAFLEITNHYRQGANRQTERDTGFID